MVKLSGVRSRMTFEKITRGRILRKVLYGECPSRDPYSYPFNRPFEKQWSHFTAPSTVGVIHVKVPYSHPHNLAFHIVTEFSV